MKWPGQVSEHVRNLLARTNLCHTAALGRHKFRCSTCQSDAILYNACGERSCPRCNGAKRQDWLDKTAETILPGRQYFQIVLTVGSSLSDLILANRPKVYSLIMRSAWRAIEQLLRELGIRSGGSVILHTWNQRLLHHPHVHVLLPAGGLALDGSGWIEIGEAERKVLQQKLGLVFRKILFAGIARLHRRGELNLLNKKLIHLQDTATFAALLKSIAPRGLHVFVQPPPTNSSDPGQVLKYLARYISGGPISNSRIVSHKNGIVIFKARSLQKPPPGEPYELVDIKVSGIEFVRRWSIHLLPKSFFRIRHFGGLCNPQRKKYLAHCHEVLGLTPPSDDHSFNGQPTGVPVSSSDLATDSNIDLAIVAETNSDSESSNADPSSELVSLADSVIDAEINSDTATTSASLVVTAAAIVIVASIVSAPDIEPDSELDLQKGVPKYHCRKCDEIMTCTERNCRPSWRDTFSGPHRPDWYTPPPSIPKNAQPRPPPELVRVYP